MIVFYFVCCRDIQFGTQRMIFFQKIMLPVNGGIFFFFIFRVVTKAIVAGSE